MAGSVERGRVITRWLVTGQMVVTLGGLIAAVTIGEPTYRGMLRIALSLTFAVATYRGVRWAAFASAIMMFASAIGALYWAVEFFAALSYWSAALLVLGALAVVAGVHLMLSPDVRAFQAFQRETRGGWRLEKPAQREAKGEEASASGEEASASRVQPERSLTEARRERLLQYAAILTQLIILMEWAIGYFTGGFPARATLTLLGALPLLVLAFKGSSYGRFGGLGIAFILIVISVVRFGEQKFHGAPSFMRTFAEIDLLLLGVALVGFILGVERRSVAANPADRALRGLFGALIGAFIAFVGGRPDIAFCRTEGADYWREMRCNDFLGEQCEEVEGCKSVPAQCVPECELASASKDCERPCTWQNDRCVHPKCGLEGDACGPTPACEFSRDSADKCENKCSAHASFRECRSTGVCDWVECAGVPQPCSAHSYLECPGLIGCRGVRR